MLAESLYLWCPYQWLSLGPLFAWINENSDPVGVDARRHCMRPGEWLFEQRLQIWHSLSPEKQPRRFWQRHLKILMSKGPNSE